MPSIRELFSDPELIEEGEDAEIDIDKVLDSVTDILNDRHPTVETPPEEEQEPSPQTDETEVVTDSGLGEETVEVEQEPVPPPAPAPSADPLMELPADRRAALLALDQAIMSDESKRAAVFGILSDQPQTVPAPALPDHIDPDSFEAKIWQEQQEMKATLQGMSAHQRDQQLAFEKQQVNTAAHQAGDLFSQKYGDRLSKDEILEIAKYAGETGVAAGFANTPEGRRNPAAAFGQALESVLWSNEVFRGKVLDTAPPKPVGEQPEAQERKRKLKAVSGAASPVSGPSPKRPPAETGADGRLTEKSRQDLVKELANGIARQSSEGTY